MFRRVLIANRGEIAVRIIRACQELNVETVAVYSDADADAIHVKLADYAYHIGPADASASYLNGTAIINAALSAHADAIHPGYGFLSENADFADMVVRAGITFIGPSADVIRQVGNKDAAREAMRQAGLPMTQGSNPLRSVEEACLIAENLTFPVILKPVAGGGGQGMIVVEDQTQLINALGRINIENAGYYIEKYVGDARHIEVQIMADHYGHVIHLGERECSLQRRNQKVLEEAPSSGLTPAMRKRVGELGIMAAKSVNYTNVGTVEFLLDKKTGEFYFMEINPRIQVEHAITEAVTGIDLVRKQIRIAAGEPLNLKQENIRVTGHAIECRINAEDAEMNFMPCPGQISFYHQPGGPYVRIDSGVCAGSTVPPYYDSLIAKVIVHGRTRGDAIRVMKRALREFKITGVKTLIDFHLQVLNNKQFCSGNVDTQFIRKHHL